MKTHTKPLTNAQRQSAYKARQRKAGLIPVSYLLTTVEKVAVERLLIELRAQRTKATS